MKKGKRAYSEQAIEEVFRERESFLVVGLTGRIGSGCTSASEIFAKDARSLNLPHAAPVPHMKDRGFQNQQRQERIIERYAMAGHWQAFDIVKVRDVLTSFVLENLGGFANLVARLTGGRQGT